MVLGHEAAGVVEATGAQVKGIAAGDHVVLTFIPACGTCRWCRKGLHHLCAEGPRITQGPQLDGTYRRRDRNGGDGRRLLHDRRLCRAHRGRPGVGHRHRQGRAAGPRQPRRLRRAGGRRRGALSRTGQARRQRPGRRLRRRRHERRARRPPVRGVEDHRRRHRAGQARLGARVRRDRRRQCARRGADPRRARTHRRASASITLSSASTRPKHWCRRSAPPPRPATSS